MENKSKVVCAFLTILCLLAGTTAVTPLEAATQNGSIFITERGYSMAIKTDGSLWAWGYNKFGQIGDGTTDDKSNPVKVMDGEVAMIFPMYYTSTFNADGSLWGKDMEQ